MTGLELFKTPGTTAGEIADIVSNPCPPVVPEVCDKFSCRECWLAWLATGNAPKEKDSTATGEGIDLSQLRRVGIAALSINDPCKSYSKREEQLTESKAPLHPGYADSSQSNSRS